MYAEKKSNYCLNNFYRRIVEYKQKCGRWGHNWTDCRKVWKIMPCLKILMVKLNKCKILHEFIAEEIPSSIPTLTKGKTLEGRGRTAHVNKFYCPKYMVEL